MYFRPQTTESFIFSCISMHSTDDLVILYKIIKSKTCYLQVFQSSALKREQKEVVYSFWGRCCHF